MQAESENSFSYGVRAHLKRKFRVPGGGENLKIRQALGSHRTPNSFVSFSFLESESGLSFRNILSGAECSVRG
jgi:hypothetical protein